jgi:hypothetical protein
MDHFCTIECKNHPVISVCYQHQIYTSSIDDLAQQTNDDIAMNNMNINEHCYVP